MNQENCIQQIENLVKKDMENICTAHDFYHIERVWKMAKILTKKEQLTYPEPIDSLIVEASALLHEYFDEKFFDKKKLETRKEELQEFLLNIDITPEQVDHIFWIIQKMGYGNSLNRPEDFFYTIEFMITEDADRLEAVGAIGIARTFAYGGKKGRHIYDPEIPWRKKISKNNYRHDEDTTSINHFYEKLLNIKKMMHTPTAKKIAEKRHIFTKKYLEEFLKEWNVEIGM